MRPLVLIAFRRLGRSERGKVGVAQRLYGKHFARITLHPVEGFSGKQHCPLPATMGDGHRLRLGVVLVLGEVLLKLRGSDEQHKVLFRVSAFFGSVPLMRHATVLIIWHR